MVHAGTIITDSIPLTLTKTVDQDTLAAEFERSIKQQEIFGGSCGCCFRTVMLRLCLEEVL